MNKILSYVLVLLVSLFIFLNDVMASEKEIVNLYLFYSNTCRHCEKERKLLDKLESEYDNLNVYSYEVSNNDNKEIMEKVSNYLDEQIMTVPFTIIGDKSFNGYNSSEAPRKFRQIIEFYGENGYEDKIGELLNINELPKVVTDKDIDEYLKELDSKIISIPFLGNVNLVSFALPVVTVIMGLLDGFNPCAMWVLLFLISMLIGMKDKKRMWTLGLTFILTSAIIYFLLMVSWLKITTYLSSISLIRLFIGIVALLGGGFNLYSYLKHRHDDGCEIVNEKKRNKIFGRIKKFTTEKSFVLALFGIIVLAISVNFVELACSAGLPVMFIEILKMNSLTNFEYYMYILLYILFFLIDDIIVFVMAMMTMQLTGFSTKYGKISKLIGGILLILIGILMILKPEWLMFNFK